MYEIFQAIVNWSQFLGWPIPAEIVFGGIFTFGGLKALTTKYTDDVGHLLGFIGMIIGIPILITGLAGLF
jgi:hypothetical protein